MSETAFVVITAARDEAAFLGYTIASVAAQSVRPAQWIIVDDGSSDETLALAQAAARRHPWIKAIHRSPAGPRDTGASATAAITYGLAHVEVPDYHFLFNLDADMVIGPRYFAVLLEKFAAFPALGVAAGELYDFLDGKVVKTRPQQFAMVGALKAWRRECFLQLGGLAPGEGWEGIDSLKAIMQGWEAITFPDAELRGIHLKPRERGWLRHGRALHFAGAHPLWVLASALYHLSGPPPLKAGWEILRGYAGAWLAGAPRYEDPGFRSFQRRWHWARLAKGVLPSRWANRMGKRQPQGPPAAV